MPDNPMMNVDEAVEGFKKRLDKFAEKWKTNNEKRPSDWPDQLPECEWLESILMAFDENWEIGGA